MAHSNDPKISPSASPEPLSGEFTVKRQEFVPTRGRTTIIPAQRTTPAPAVQSAPETQQEAQSEDLAQTNFVFSERAALQQARQPSSAIDRGSYRTRRAGKIRRTSSRASQRAARLSLGSGTVLDRVITWITAKLIALEELLLPRLPASFQRRPVKQNIIRLPLEDEEEALEKISKEKKQSANDNS